MPKGRYRKCPFCGHDKFIRKGSDIVQMYDDGDSVTDEIWGLNEGYTYICNNCEADVTNVELS